ncbi:MAG: SusD/RagB family nutrient-binding outer membrane lipoprotein [Bacteroidetes bacterium]|nr:MAG: SusD/RagB family nutrient-binding outer membrane lipoprotein [Bacteroidota bacterium]
MKKIYLIFIVLIALSVSCTKNFEEMNTDKKHPVEVPGETLFSNAQVALADQIASTNVNLNIWKLYSQYWTETTYIDEANYDIVNRTIPDNTFRTYYRDILVDFKEAARLINAAPADGEAAVITKTNKLQIIELLNVYAYQRLVDMFGNIPYSEALNVETNITPAYDDAFGIYQDLISRIDAALGSMDDTGDSFGDADLYYGGDVEAWAKFGNSLKLKIGITLSDSDPGLAQTTVEAAAAGVFAESGDDCLLVYMGTTPNTNPLYEDLVLSGRKDFVPANTIVDIMNDLSDPRRDDYFEINGLSEYTGGDYGYSNSYLNFSHISDKIQVAEFPCPLLTYTEIEFYLAEAAERGFSVGGDAESHYNAGVENSIIEWGGTTDDYSAYIGGVAYASANWKELVGTQSWIASYTRGFVGWTNWRRLDFPELNIPESPESDDEKVPKRFLYPVNEQTLNAANYYSAAGAIEGGDMMSSKLFWDTQSND